MKRFLTIVILSVFCLASISQSFADIVVSNSSTFYQDELNKTVQGRYYKKVVDNIIKEYGSDLELIKNLRKNISNVWVSNKNISGNRDLSNMLNYLSSLVDIILKNFASEENKQFILALEKAGKNSSNIVFPNFASVSYSRIYPYQRASMDMWGINGGLGVAYFYRTNRDEEWKYFTGTQEVISCNEYNTLDIRKAFFDYICYDINSGKYKIINDVDNPNNWPIIDIVPGGVKAN